MARPAGNCDRHGMNSSQGPDKISNEHHIPATVSGPYPPRAGNDVRALVDGLPAFRRICAAIAAARHSIWLTVAFIAPDFRMPDGQGSLFDVLDRAAARGLDVRVIFWRPRAESSGYGKTFAGTPAERAMLAARASRFRARWDRAPGAACQHQKTWLVDAGHPGEIAFIGGINLNPRALVAPGHGGEIEIHDVYVEVAGPAATDVHHNFVQRWNEASERAAADGVWGHDGADTMAFPGRLSPPAGPSLVQIQRTIPAGHYSNGHPPPLGHRTDIAAGEQSIFEQYRLAIDAARSTIYIENQAVPVPQITARLEAALRRGVDIVLLVPADPDEHVRAARRHHDHRARFEGLTALGHHENFMLAGIAGRTAQGRRCNVYVHGKIMLVDDAWATIGSCNLHANSLFAHSEMNASIHDPAGVRALRCALLGEHLGRDTGDLDDRGALACYRRTARLNRSRRDDGDHDWQGLAFRLDPATYGA
ncbi:MAG: phosphatidylserine/phosphatidylglycerophosphate/cardiolipin synthase family protein [Rhodospirillales bacterium]|nr:phosphatidylserine/phosphatidylglycerophosphate/cardiolipin synthase family protein [Rhodospirillales bacterium]